MKGCMWSFRGGTEDLRFQLGGGGYEWFSFVTNALFSMPVLSVGGVFCWVLVSKKNFISRGGFGVFSTQMSP